MSRIVSVIIALYNGELFIEEALKSVFSQTYRPIEVLVIDDGSTDGSADLVQRHDEVRYIWQENQGSALARMKGIEHAKGDLIAFLDQDDIWPENKLKLQTEVFNRDSTCQCVIGNVCFFKDETLPEVLPLKKDLFKEDRLSYLPGVVMARKDLLKKYPFSSSFKNGSDTDWFFRLKEANIPIKALSDVLLNARIHAENLSHQISDHYGDLLQVIRSSLKRKRRTKALISVIIPVLNGEKFIAEAIESVFSQTYSNTEIIIIDDGSTDRTKEIATSYKEMVRYVYQTSIGIGAARNRGVEMAQGEYLAFLDADDIWIDTKLQKQIELFEKKPSLDLIFGKIVHFFSDQKLKEKFLPCSEHLSGFLAGTLLVKKACFESVGNFTTGYQVGEFIEWYLRAQRAGRNIHVLDDVLLKRRIHGENTTLKQKKNHMDYLRIIRKYGAISSGLSQGEDKE